MNNETDTQQLQTLKENNFADQLKELLDSHFGAETAFTLITQTPDVSYDINYLSNVNKIGSLRMISVIIDGWTGKKFSVADKLDESS